jgi:hypothetical protein
MSFYQCGEGKFIPLGKKPLQQFLVRSQGLLQMLDGSS